MNVMKAVLLMSLPAGYEASRINAQVGEAKVVNRMTDFSQKSMQDCSNVKDWNFFNSEVTQNNLGGVGPNKEDKEEVRYANVADGVDLVLTTDSKNYATNPKVKEINGKMNATGCDNNGILGKFGQVNVKGNTAVAMTFTLVESGTDTPVEVAPEQTIFFSVYDMDGNPDKKYGSSFEYVDFTTPVDSWNITDKSTVQVKGDNDHLSAKAGRIGDDADNPTDPLAMTQLQKNSAVWITYKGRNTWGMTFGEKNNPKGKGGRNLMFAGRAEGDCPPGDVPPPPGACPPGGIEGMIKGGGRVCCPDACGGPRFSGAPNACGGPQCEKGPDGKRNNAISDFRFKNCCVGKPVSGATDKDTITAPYGIVSQGRFCKGLGEDEPPCINRLSRESNPASAETLE